MAYVVFRFFLPAFFLFVDSVLLISDHTTAALASKDAMDPLTSVAGESSVETGVAIRRLFGLCRSICRSI